MGRTYRAEQRDHDQRTNYPTKRARKNERRSERQTVRRRLARVGY